MGQLGHSDYHGQPQPKHIVTLKERVVAVSAGTEHSLALTASGAVWSWGSGHNGQLGHGDWETQLLPKNMGI